MLIYTRRAPPKAPKKRSRAGCIHCKEKKKKCNEKRPQCDRCMERNLQCEYEAVKPRKRRRISFAGSQDATSPTFCDEHWLGRLEGIFGSGALDENEFNKWETISNFQYPESDTSTVDEDNLVGTNNNVEVIPRTDQLPSPPLAIVRSRSQYPDLAMIAPSPTGSPLLEFSAPVFQEFTEMRNRRALIDHFCNVLSHLLVFKDTGNPFRQLILPLSHGSSPVMNALFALSSAHLEYRGVENQEKSLDFHNKALQGLAMLIEQNDPTCRAEVLGAIILLVYYEVLVLRGSSNIVNGHLKGAMAIMKSGPQISTPATQFLERAFRFYDVIAALSLGTAPNTINLSTSISNSYSNPPITSPSEGSPLGCVDTLLGFSTDLWPIIHRLSHLLSYKVSLEEAIAAGQTSKATVLRTELESTSQAIELALKNWRPNIISETTPDSPEGSTDSSSSEEQRLQAILNNAEAYRQSAFIYLYRTIHSQPRSHLLVQRHTHLSLEACSKVVQLSEKCHDGPMSALLWPLFVAACEATALEDRTMAQDAFARTEKRQGMLNIARAWEVVQEIWRRGDLGEEDIDWREICAEKGCNIVLG